MNQSARFGFRVSLALVLFGVLALAHARIDLRAEAASAADARATYNAKCARCHGRDGRGKTARGRRTRARDLTDASWQDDVSDERLFNSINRGRGKMPSFKKSLSESEIDALVNHLRRLRR
jgi:mono/diheme cytochrome c family protein